MTRMNCIDHDTKLCKNLLCDLKRFRNNSNLINVGCDVVYTPVVFARFTAYYKFGVRYKPLLLNMTKNICEVLGNGYKIGADVNMFFGGILKHYTDPNPKCPFQGNYSLLDLPITDIKFPPIIPAGDYRMDVRVYNLKNQTLVFPRIYATVKSKGIYDLAMG